MGRVISSLPFVLIVFGVLHVELATCVTRKYYIAARDFEWDYAETGMNLVNKDQQSYADRYLTPGKDRIGSKYLKTTYFGFTDSTFTTEIAKDVSLGILGPTIRAEVDDVIQLVFFNNASGVYSAHPHGAHYLKENEGALYLDGTSGRYKKDDQVKPGETVTVIWNVTERDSPGRNDPNCIPWVYHSHVNTVMDTSNGLVGAFITCRKGILDDDNQRTDVDFEFPLLVKIYDENLSGLLTKNVDRYCQDPGLCHKLMDEEDKAFTTSNQMHSINAKMFGHLKGLEVCVGDRVAFQVIGMGNEFDVHSLYFPGQTLDYQHTRGDTVSVFTATFVAAETTPTRVGTWVLSDMVDGNAREGTTALYVTKNCTKKSNPHSQPEHVKEYFLSAEEVEWDYGPGGKDRYTHTPLTEKNSKSAYFFEKGDSKIGGVYKKAKFFQYTDGTFNKKVNRPIYESHMGILGPVIDAEVGDTVKVTLKNDASFPVSFLPHAMTFNSSEEIGNMRGASKTAGGVVQPGDKFTYTFKVPANLLDETADDCQNYIYTSGVDSTQDHQAGLVGPVVICRKGYSLVKNKPKRFFIYLTMFDENQSPLLDDTINTYLTNTSKSVDKSSEDFTASNKIFTINGLSFATAIGMTMCVGSNVTWYTMALGSDKDVHGVNFDGNTFSTGGRHRNIQQMVAGSTATLHMVPDNKGSWLVYSMTNDANSGGAYALYNVLVCGRSQPEDSYTVFRTFHIAAEEVDWNFAPKKRSIIDGTSLDMPDQSGYIFVTDQNNMIGDVYHKAVYREYTDHTFMHRKPRDFRDRHLDLLGPAIRAEVGEAIVVHFHNKATRPYSMHPHGLKYSHDDSGKAYGNKKADVLPGQTKVYTWYVPQRAGPGPNDPDCIPWLYYSAVDQARDTVSGLMGPIVICRPGTLGRDGRRSGDHRELFVLMSIIDENKSWYLEENIRKYAPARIGTDYVNDGDFDESNKMHAINGRLFGNNRDMLVEYNSTLDFYFMVLGSTEDLHTFHTHGHTFLHQSQGHRDDVISMFPGMAETVTMKAYNPGTWFLHCHTLDHIEAGMETTYTVLKPGVSIPKGDGSTDEIIG